ncbi:MAG TPA: hypothetical protein VFP35_03990 [Candidatus Saccharimonadales bacterium]|nr:hypothetical protein [Candidatus Saccharimonadales bacterium]
MSNHEQFQPYIDGAKPLLGEEIDRKVAQTSVVYYGEMPDGLETIARENHPAIEVEDTSGNSKYSVLISGDLASAKTVLVKAMAWSDHPGRGFEALREALIADDNSRLAVIGVSFPGTFLTSHAMTDKQRERV